MVVSLLYLFFFFGLPIYGDACGCGYNYANWIVDNGFPLIPSGIGRGETAGGHTAFYFWMWAVAMRFFGNTVETAHLLPALFSMFAIAGTYKLGRELVGKAMGIAGGISGTSSGYARCWKLDTGAKADSYAASAAMRFSNCELGYVDSSLTVIDINRIPLALEQKDYVIVVPPLFPCGDDGEAAMSRFTENISSEYSLELSRVISRGPFYAECCILHWNQLDNQ